MGVKNLNSYLKKNCTTRSIQQKHLSEFQNKTIVIDTSIYLYRFVSENALLENMYMLISILLEYKITPIFVFDGKPPKEKAETLKNRYNERKKAKAKYYEMLDELKDNKLELNSEMSLELYKLKRQMATINQYHIELVKKLMDYYGVAYILSETEADSLCADLVKQHKADYCLSDDTDMFMYNCPRVLRNISLLNHTVIEYDTTQLYSELKMNYEEFFDIMILAGTDYNRNSIELDKLMKEFYVYKDTKEEDTFYSWLMNKKYQIDNIELDQTKELFMKENQLDVNKLSIHHKNEINHRELYKLLEDNGFIFI